MLTTILVIALCGVAGGYAISRAAWLGDAQDRWARARDLADAALHGELDEWIESAVPPFGSVALDNRIVPDMLATAEGKTARRWRRIWAANYLKSCSTCSGTHFVWASLLIWAVVAWATNEPAPATWATAAPTLGAGVALHVGATGLGNKYGVFD